MHPFTRLSAAAAGTNPFGGANTDVSSPLPSHCYPQACIVAYSQSYTFTNQSRAYFTTVYPTHCLRFQSPVTPTPSLALTTYPAFAYSPLISAYPLTPGRRQTFPVLQRHHILRVRALLGAHGYNIFNQYIYIGYVGSTKKNAINSPTRQPINQAINSPTRQPINQAINHLTTTHPIANA